MEIGREIEEGEWLVIDEWLIETLLKLELIWLSYLLYAEMVMWNVRGIIHYSNRITLELPAKKMFGKVKLRMEVTLTNYKDYSVPKWYRNPIIKSKTSSRNVKNAILNP